MIGVSRIKRHTHVVIDGGGEITRGDGALINLGTIFVRGTDDLTVTEAATREGHGHDVRPVVAPIGAALRAERGRAAKLTHGDHECVIKHAALGEIADERGDHMVENRQQWAEAIPNATVRRDVVAMIVPRARPAVIAQIMVTKDEPRSTRRRASSACLAQSCSP